MDELKYLKLELVKLFLKNATTLIFCCRHIYNSKSYLQKF